MAILENFENDIDLPVGIARGEYALNGVPAFMVLATVARAVVEKRYQPRGIKVITRLTGDTDQDASISAATEAVKTALPPTAGKFAQFDFIGWAQQAWAQSDKDRWFETVKIEGELFTLAIRFDEAGTTVTDLGVFEEWGISLTQLIPALKALQVV